jgi:hypothetical protein
MAVTVKIDSQTATINDYEWTGDESLVETLNVFLEPDGPEGSDPNPDWTVAQAAIDELGGEIVSFDILEFDPDIVY